MAGAIDLHYLEQVLETDALVINGANYTSLAKYLLEKFAVLPKIGEAFEAHGFRFEVIEIVDRRIQRVKVKRIETAPANKA